MNHEQQVKRKDCYTPKVAWNALNALHGIVKHTCDSFPIRNGLEKRDASSPLVFRGSGAVYQYNCSFTVIPWFTCVIP
jgi:hypothetical protein